MKTSMLSVVGLAWACAALFLANPNGFAEETVPETSGGSSKILLPNQKDEQPVTREREPRRREENKKTTKPIDYREETVVLDGDKAPRAETVSPETVEVRPAPTEDLIGDKVPASRSPVDPGLTAAPSRQLLEDMPSSGPLSTKARQCYKLLAELKANAEKINTGLDDGGKEVTLLIRISDDLGTNITDLADLWPENKTFLDHCVVAKRQSIVLNEELSRVPRNWRALRWAMNSALVHISKLRQVARDVADAEPKPIAVQGKDGKIQYTDPEPEPIDPVLARREAAVTEARKARETIKRQEEEKAKKRMPTDLKNTR